MFSDQYDLTQAVLEGRKTMTRRIVPDGTLRMAQLEVKIHGGELAERIKGHSPYLYLDRVAIAQRYQDAGVPASFIYNQFEPNAEFTPGWKNKMYVRADLMPHQIIIKDVRVERIQDISDEDCLREGVRKLESDGCPIMFTFDGWSFKNKVNRCTDSPKEAFEALFKKLSGKKAWDDNPWVFVYEFELVK